jgi:hypothetical protein
LGVKLRDPPSQNASRRPIGKQPVQLRLIQRIRQSERCWIDAVLAQNSAGIASKVCPQRCVLPEPRDESRNGNRLGWRRCAGLSLLRIGGNGCALKGGKKSHDESEQRTDRCWHGLSP